MKRFRPALLLVSLALIGGMAQADTVKKKLDAPKGHATAIATIKPVTKAYALSPQMQISDVQKAANAGYTLIINNRPDGESPDQPTSAQMAAAAQKAGIDYVHIPFRPGHITPAIITAMEEALKDQKGPVVAYCRSGNRAAAAWAMTRVKNGVLSPEEAITAGHRAGYNLEHHRKTLQSLAKLEDASQAPE